MRDSQELWERFLKKKIVNLIDRECTERTERRFIQLGMSLGFVQPRKIRTLKTEQINGNNY